MRMRYSQEADAIYIRLKENKIVESDELSDGIIVDYIVSGLMCSSTPNSADRR
jgi:uncharacterized protein YuzE